MKYKCKKCGNVFKPGQFCGDCPKCGSSDAEVIYEYKHTASNEVTPNQK